MLSPDVPVTVAGGQIRGTLADADPNVIAFKGVPYAAPPVGDLRWRPPEPVVSWDGTRDADTAGPICMQGGGGDEPQSEDCLFLNIWAPRQTEGPLAVMLWIHGGGYVGGSGSIGIYDGTHLASKGVVLVTMNYRLNVFGFLAHPALSAESAHDASGNYGLMDMVAALEWVRDNIVMVGGDPSRVTIFGESAGGGAVMALMLVPQAEGLFHRAIAQSTYIHGWDRPLRTPELGWEPAEAQGIRIAEALGASSEDAQVAMRAATAADVLAAAIGSGSTLLARTGNIWAPNVDGWIVPDDPLRMYQASQQHDVPLIAGMNGNEGSLLRFGLQIDDVDGFESYVSTTHSPVASAALAHYDVTSADAVEPGVDHLIHDMYFAGPVRTQVRAHAAVTSPAWLYHFTHVPPTQSGAGLGSHHAAELAYVFGTMTSPTDSPTEQPFVLGTEGAWTDSDRRLSETMMAYWTQFAATGDPTREHVSAWPAFDASGDQHLIFAEHVVPGTAAHRKGADLFDGSEAGRRGEN